MKRIVTIIVTAVLAVSVGAATAQAAPQAQAFTRIAFVQGGIYVAIGSSNRVEAQHLARSFNSGFQGRRVYGPLPKARALWACNPPGLSPFWIGIYASARKLSLARYVIRTITPDIINSELACGRVVI